MTRKLSTPQRKALTLAATGGPWVGVHHGTAPRTVHSLQILGYVDRSFNITDAGRAAIAHQAPAAQPAPAKPSPAQRRDLTRAADKQDNPEGWSPYEVGAVHAYNASLSVMVARGWVTPKDSTGRSLITPAGRAAIGR